MHSISILTPEVDTTLTNLGECRFLGNCIDCGAQLFGSSEFYGFDTVGVAKANIR